MIMTLGEQLKKARKDLGLTQMAVANRTGLTLNTVAGLENDRTRGKGEAGKEVKVDTLVKLIAELRVPIEFSERGRKIVMADVLSLEKLVTKLTRPVKK